MPLTIRLEPVDSHVQVRFDDAPELVATFDPASLKLPNELHPDALDPPSMDECKIYGAMLFQALGGDILRTKLKTLPKAPNMHAVIALHSDDRAAHAIPWELLHDGNDWLMLQYLLVRQIPDCYLPDTPPDPTKPWRIVAQGANPLVMQINDNLHKIDRLQVVAELDQVGDTINAMQPPPAVRWQRIAPTYAALINLACNEPLIFHFTGHGAVLNGEAVLCFDDGTLLLDARSVRDLAVDLRQRVYLAFLNACRTADSSEPHANLAFDLVKDGVPLVLGSQFSLLDRSALAFSKTFYEHLVAGSDPAVATFRARRALKTEFPNDPRQWIIPVLYRADGWTWTPIASSIQDMPPAIPPPPLRLDSLPTPTSIRRGNQRSLFVGREQELHAIATLLRNHRIVTIRGAGGMGKTALVSALAESLHHSYPHGVFAVTLALPEGAPLDDTKIRMEWAKILGLNISNFSEYDYDQQLNELKGYCEMLPNALLIWDNYETVLWRLGRDHYARPSTADDYAAATRLYQLVETMANRNIAMLFTSREAPLDIIGEQLYPDANNQLHGLNETEASALFVRHATMRYANHECITALWNAVEGSPLAIELAAKRWQQTNRTEQAFIEELHHELVLARNEGAPAHQLSIMVNVRLTVNALEADLRTECLALTVIKNPVITPLHAAVVWGLDQVDDKEKFVQNCWSALERLQHASLLQAVGGYDETNRAQAYRIQPVIGYALNQLAHDPIIDQPSQAYLATAIQRYLTWCARMINQSYGKLTAETIALAKAWLPDWQTAVPQMEDEDRGWIAWRLVSIFLESHESTILPRVFDNRRESTELVSPMVDLLSLLDIAMNDAKSHKDQELLARSYYAKGYLQQSMGDLGSAKECYDASINIFRTLGDSIAESRSLLNRAFIYGIENDFSNAMELLNQAMAIYLQADDKIHEAHVLYQQASIQRVINSYNIANDLYNRALFIYREVGDRLGESNVLYQLAFIYSLQNRFSEALNYYDQSLLLKQIIHDRGGECDVLYQKGSIKMAEKDYDVALEFFDKSYAISMEISDIYKTATISIMQGQSIALQGDIETGIGKVKTGLFLLTDNYPNHDAEIATALDILQTLESLQGE